MSSSCAAPGAAALTGLTVTDTLGTTNFPATGGTVQLTPLTYQAGTLRYFVNGVLQTAPAVTVLANGIRIEGITVPAGGVSTLVYTTASMPLPIPRQRARLRTP